MKVLLKLILEGDFIEEDDDDLAGDSDDEEEEVKPVKKRKLN
jgi:hypothetical protein